MSDATSEGDRHIGIEFPNELQNLIFDYAARSDGRCARELVQVSQYVNQWWVAFNIRIVTQISFWNRINPILYERIVVRGPQSAMCLLRTIRERPRGYFTSFIKSLAFSDDVMLPLVKPILAEFSKSIIVFTVFRTSDSPDNFLQFVRSPYLRRLTLVHKRVPGSRPYLWENPYEIPSDMVSLLTHLAVVIDYQHGGWRTLTEATRRHNRDHADPDLMAPFRNLTCFAVSHLCWTSTKDLRLIAKNLRCFAILGSEATRGEENERTLKAMVKLQDRRFILISKYGRPGDWSVDNAFTPSNFWMQIEAMVSQGYISDEGALWADQIRS